MLNSSLNNLTLIEFIKSECGGVATVALEADISPRAIYKWTAKDALPRTEFTNETNYSQLLAKLSGFPASEIKERFRPQPQPEEA